MPGLKPEFKSYYQKLIAENPGQREDIAYGASEIHKTAHPVIFPSLDELTSKGAEFRVARQPGYVKTFAQGVARGTEGLAGGVGGLTRWGGDVTGVETLSEIGKEASDYWKRAASEGWEKADEDTFSGTFMENPSFKRATGIVGEATPSLAAGLVAGTIAGPLAAGFSLGALEGAGTYEESRAKGKSIPESSLYGGGVTLTTGILEALGIGKILGAKGGLARGLATGAVAEGGTEAAQTIAQNLIAKYGYDNTRKWYQGIVESIIGGVGLGGPAGAVSSQFNAQSPQVQEALVEGMEPRDIAEIVKSTEDDLSKYTEEITAKAPKDLFDSTGVESESGIEVEVGQIIDPQGGLVRPEEFTGLQEEQIAKPVIEPEMIPEAEPVSLDEQVLSQEIPAQAVQQPKQVIEQPIEQIDKLIVEEPIIPEVSDIEKIDKQPDIQDDILRDIQAESRPLKRISKIDKPIVNRILADSNIFGDSSNAQAIVSKGFNSIERQNQEMVLSKVRESVNDQKVLKAIIESIPINVMDSLLGSEWTPNRLLNDPSMLTHRLSVSGDVPVLKSVISFIDSLAPFVKSIPTKTSAKKSDLVLPPVSSDKSDPTLKTDTVKRLDHIISSEIAGQKIKVNTTPTEAQKQAGNYLKGSIKLSGLDIAVENPEGSTRSGVDETGKEWSTTMKSHYGYFKRTEGKDGDQVDTFIKPGTEDVQKVFIVDQLDGKGGFDEHKIVMGVNTKIQARKEYLKNYDKGWKVGPISEMSIDDFKSWLGDAKKVKLPVDSEFFKGKKVVKEKIKKPVEEPKLSTEKVTKPSSKVDRKSLEALPYVKSVSGKEGKYRLHFKNNISMPLIKVEQIFEEGKVRRGKFTPGQGAEIAEIGDIRTVAHENLHFFESIGLIAGKDLRLLTRAGEKMFGVDKDKTELRAKYFEAVSKTAKPDSLVGRILEKIKDFIAQLRRVFGKVKQTISETEGVKGLKKSAKKAFKRTPEDVVLDIEKGKIFNQPAIIKDLKSTVPVYSKAADKWYSQMTKQVNEKLPGKGTGKSFLSTLESWVKKGQIKQEEFEWSGVREFLEGKSAEKLNKSDIVSFLDENRVVIEEVEKGIKLKKEKKVKEADISYTKEKNGVNWIVTVKNSERKLTFASWKDEDSIISDAVHLINKDIDQDNLNIKEELKPKFQQYQLPGGKNYKELLLTLPRERGDVAIWRDRFQELSDKDDRTDLTTSEEKEMSDLLKKLESTENPYLKEGTDFQSTHFGEKNVLAHVRFSEREVDGKKVLHIEELQSDWHQAGRKEGYQSDFKKRITWVKNGNTLTLKGDGVRVKIDIEKGGENYYVYTPSGILGRSFSRLEGAKTEGEAWAVSVIKKQGVPDAPWKKTWPIKTFQRMVRYATENNFDTIAWTPGDIQAERYDLSKSIGSLDYDTSDNVLTAKDVDNTRTVIQETVAQDELDDYVGKEVADRIRQKINKQDLDEDDTITLSGLDLKVGGEGMKGFYDQILPKEINKFFNKKAWGNAKVGEIDATVPPAPGSPPTHKSYSVKLHSLEITPEMKSKSLSEGMPQFSTEPAIKPEEEKPSFKDTQKEIIPEDYTKNFQDSKNIKGTIAQNLRMAKKEIQQGLDKYLGAISTRLGNINPKLKSKIRKLSFDTDLKGNQDNKKVKPLLDKVKNNMTPEDTAAWDYARKNSHMPKINELIKKYNLENEYQAYRDTIDNIRKEAIDVGLDVGYIKDYAPRILKDSRGFLEAIGKEGDWDVISRKLREKAQNMGMTVDEMNPDQKADVITAMLYGGSYGLGGVPATKERKLKKIPANLNKFYMDSDAALVSHIHSMRKAIEARKFFGKVPDRISKIKTKLNKAQKEIANFDKITEERNKVILLKIDNLESKKSLTDKQKTELDRLNYALRYYQKNRSERLKDVNDDIYEFEQIINKYKNQRDFSENIGTYVNELIENKEISAADEQQLIDILTARFNEKGTRGLIQAYKNLSYIDTMGSVTSALTQIGDLAWSAYEGGMIPTLKNAFKSSIGKSRITKEDVGIERVAQEFADAGTLGKAVSTVFKLVGLEKMDSIGKESLLNTALDKYQKQANKNPEKLKTDIKNIFEDETDSVIQDLKDDKITDNVKLLVYNRLLDFQPVALSEMPQKYLDAGNGRIFYMLKSFTLKQFDVFRNEVYKDLKSKDPKVKIEGMKKFVKLASFFVLANAGADELKDLVLGRKTDLDDRIVDNMLRLGGISKFVTWKARTEGIGSAAIRQILPPFKFIDAATKDIVKAGDDKGLETLASIPVVGKLAYWHMGKGVAKRGDLWNRRLNKLTNKLKEVKQDYEESADRPTFLREHRKELADYRRIKSFKNRINKIKRRINKLKKLTQTEVRKKAIIKLEKKRTDMIKAYLAKEKEK